MSDNNQASTVTPQNYTTVLINCFDCLTGQSFASGSASLMDMKSGKLYEAIKKTVAEALKQSLGINNASLENIRDPHHYAIYELQAFKDKEDPEAYYKGVDLTFFKHDFITHNPSTEALRDLPNGFVVRVSTYFYAMAYEFEKSEFSKQEYFGKN